MVSFEWDEEDDNARTRRDEDTEEEGRFVTLATDALGRLLVIVYTWRGEDIRLISARTATRGERKQFEG